MVTKVPQRIIASTGVTSGSYTNSNITVNESGQITSASSGTGGGASTDVPKISNLQVTNSSWTVLDDTAVDVVGGYILLTGVNFVTGCLVYIGTTPASSVAFVSSTTVRVTVPAITAGTYPVYLINPDGGVAIRVPGVTISASPSWQTTSLPNQYDATAISLQLLATDATSYTITSGSLPPGLTMDSSGLITGTVTGVTVDTTYTFTVVATDSQLQDSPQVFTVTITISDPYFNLTTLLLTGNSGATVLTDSSTNNFAITPVGDVRASNFSPYLTGWSNYFDGSGDYIQSPTNVAFQMGNGDYTLECWAYITASFPQTFAPLVDLRRTSPNYVAPCLEISNTYKLQLRDGSTGTNPLVGATTLSLNTWYHLAITRQSGTTRCFVNGVVDGTVTNTTNFNSTVGFTCGSSGDNLGGGYYFPGYVSNIRIVKGTALYTANFTPSTVPLTAVTNTSLLTCNANRLLDSSTNNFSITKSGDVRVDSFNPFNLTNSGTTGSMYFDGTGDYTLTSAIAVAAANEDFTIEYWFDATGSGTGWGYHIATVASSGYYFIFGADPSTGRLGGNWPNGSNRFPSGDATFSGTSYTTNTWNHVALVRSSNVIKVYLNGQASTTTWAITDALGLGSSFGNQIYIGGFPSIGGNAYYSLGYMSDVRIVKGTAVYTSNFTPPTAPLTAVTNTQLLTLQNKQSHNNHSFQDSSTNNHLITRSGNATQGTFSPFSQSGWGNYFDGSSYLGGPSSSSAFSFGTGAYTVECWVYFTSYAGSGNESVIFCPGNATNSIVCSVVRATGALTLSKYGSGSVISSSSGDVPLNTWCHLAFVRTSTASNDTKLYVNGVLKATGTDNNNWTVTTTSTIGALTLSNYGVTGYISNLRAVKGVAVYTGAFTPPTLALTATQSAGTNISAITTGQTVLLTCQSNRFVDNGQGNTGNTGFTITTSGSPSVQAFSPFNPSASWSAATYGGSGYFDGSGDYLSQTTSTAAFNLSSGDWTISFWVYKTTATDGNILNLYNTNGNTSGLSVWIDSTNRVRQDNGIAGAINAGNVGLNTWAFVQLIRSSGTTTLYINGASITTTTQAPNTAQYARFGMAADGTLPLQGYVSSLRIVKGTALSPSVPTAPDTNITNTSLLLNFTNAGIYDATSKNDLETVGNAQISTAQSKWGGSSMAFDGTGDYLISNSATTDLYAFGSGDFTVEMWIYFNSVASIQCFYDSRPGTQGAYPLIYLNSDATIRYYVNSADRITSSAVSATTWYHLAVSRTGTSTKMFINGTQSGSTYTDSTSYLNGSARPWIGSNANSPSQYLNGYIQDLRVTKGYARYTANFTPPTGAFKLR